MLIHAFASEIVDAVKIAPLRADIEKALMARLAQPEAR
jgi:hypothetical protein